MLEMHDISSKSKKVEPPGDMMKVVIPPRDESETNAIATAAVKDAEPAEVVVKVVDPAESTVNIIEPTGCMVKTVEPAEDMGKVVEPAGCVSKAVGPTAVVVNTVGVLGFKQPVLVRLSNISKECTSVKIDFGGICLPPCPTNLQSSPRCLPSTPTFKDQDNMYTLVICPPNISIEQTPLQDNKPITILNRNTVVNVLEVSEEKIKTVIEKPVTVGLKVKLKSAIQSNQPVVVQAVLASDRLNAVAKNYKNHQLIFILKPNSTNKKYKVMNQCFLAEKDPSGTIHAQIVLRCTETKFHTDTLVSNGDFIGQAVLFDSSYPDQVQQCLASSALQVGL